MSKIASLDVGLRRIGLAISLDSSFAISQKPILRRNRDQAAKDVSDFLKEWQIEKLVVGLPLGGSSEDEMRRRIEHFVSLLDFNGEIIYQDESGSSLEAKEMIRGITKQKRDGKIDSIAAKIILERWLAK